MKFLLRDIIMHLFQVSDHMSTVKINFPRTQTEVLNHFICPTSNLKLKNIFDFDK